MCCASSQGSDAPTYSEANRIIIALPNAQSHSKRVKSLHRRMIGPGKGDHSPHGKDTNSYADQGHIMEAAGLYAQ
eukprot:scaffold8713_cov84-Skeletonema_marinoi.AAC.1